MTRTAQEHCYGLVTATLFSLLACAPVHGQLLEEIVVTATKREEGIQRVPISIVAISGDSIRRDIQNNLIDATIQVPNLVISYGLTTESVHIRGIGSGNERSFEQAVGMFVDNIHMPRSRHYRSPMFDIDRIEVARGPQSVLFGLNATAGAIAVHTARSLPDDPFVADLTAEYETEYGGTALTAVVGGSPSEKLGLRLAARVLDSGDGYWKNEATGRRENSLENILMRGSMVFDVTSSVSIDAKIEYSDFERDGAVDELFTDAGNYSDGFDRLNWTRAQDASLLPLFPEAQKPGFSGDQLNLSALLAIDLQGGGSVETTLGFSNYDWHLYVDLDSSPVQIIDSGVVEDYEQSSFEVRYLSRQDRDASFIVGAYFAANDMEQEQPNLVDGNVFVGPFGFPVAGFDAGRLWSNAEFSQEEDIVSVYGLVDWRVSDTVEIRGGLRHVRSEKEHFRQGECLVRRSNGSFDDLDTAGNPNDQLLSLIGFCPTVITPAQQSRSSSNLLPEVSVQWDMSESTMVYAKAGKSAKSGGFAASTVIIPGFFKYDDETGVGFEAGIKTTIGSGKGEISVAAFDTTYKDLQLNSFDPATAAAIVTNAGEVRSRGIEFEGRWAASDSVTLGGAIGFLDANFERFDVGPCYPGEPLNPDGVSCNKTGKTPPYSPDFSGTAWLDINAPLGDRLALLGGLTVVFSDDYLTSASLDPLGQQDAYTRLDARVGIAASNGKWRLSLVGKNLTEEKINSFTEAFLGVYRGYLREPRTIWLQGTYSLGN